MVIVHMMEFFYHLGAVGTRRDLVNVSCHLSPTWMRCCYSSGAFLIQAVGTGN